jgi:hypothetical protein
VPPTNLVTSTYVVSPHLKKKYWWRNFKNIELKIIVDGLVFCSRGSTFLFLTPKD